MMAGRWDRDVVAVMKRLQSNDPNFTYFRLYLPDFSITLAEEFIRVLKTCDITHLRRLKIGGLNKIEDAKYILQIIQCNLPCLRSLELSVFHFFNFDDESFVAIVEAVSVSPHIKHLHLSFDDIGTYRCQVIAKHLCSSERRAQMESLNLRYNKIGDEGCSAIMAALLDNSSIKSLNLCRCAISQNGANAIAKTLCSENCAIEDLDLSENRIGDEGCCAIMEALCHNKSVTKLHLHHCGICDDGIEAIAKALQSDQGAFLQYLSLGEIRYISMEWARSLADALAENSSLVEVHFSCGNLESEDCITLMEALSKNSSLKTIHFPCGRIGDEGAKAIANFLQSNAGVLRHLLLYGNRFSEESWVEIAKVLTNNTHLTRLTLRFDPLSFQEKVVWGAFDGALSHNFVLQEINTQTALPTHKDFDEFKRSAKDKLAMNKKLGPVKSKMVKTGSFSREILNSLTSTSCFIEALLKVVGLGCLSVVYDLVRERPALLDLTDAGGPTKRARLH